MACKNSGSAYNLDGFRMVKGSFGNKLYCGRKLGVDKIPGSDGYCGPDNGP